MGFFLRIDTKTIQSLRTVFFLLSKRNGFLEDALAGRPGLGCRRAFGRICDFGFG